MYRIKVAERWVGKGEPCFIIAEAGVNHNGKLALAKKLIDVAKNAGADAVKFQTFHAEDLVTESAEKAGYQKVTTGKAESQFEMLKKLELSESDFKELFVHAQKKGVIFLSTPFDEVSADFVAELGVPAMKIPSGEITNFPLLRHIARKRKPIILSTGMSIIEEIGEALDVIKAEGVKDTILLHCVSAYPAKIEDMNLRAMATLRKTFKLPVGLSDHSLGITVPITAVALGACVIEKHFTLDKTLPGPDHRASLEPDELKDMIKSIRDVEKALGSGIKKPTREEEENRKAGRRSIVARVAIPRGTVITEAMLDIKRPGTGIEPKYLDEVIGLKVKAHTKKDEVLTWEKIGKK